MPSAKGSNNNNKLNQPVKVKATPLSENKAISAQDIRNQVKRVVAMPAEAVRAAMAQAVVGAAKLSVVYDALSHILSLIESGHAVDKATLKTTKAAIQTAHASDAIALKKVGKVYQQIVRLNETVVRVVSYYRTKNETISLSESRAKLIGKPRAEIARGSDASAKNVAKSITTTRFSGKWTDPAELTLGSGLTDQDLVFGFPNVTVEGVSFTDYISKIVSFKRSPADTASSSDSKTAVASKILPTPSSGTLATGDVLSYDGFSGWGYPNIYTYPEDFTNAVWSTNMAVDANNIIAPDGTLTGTKLTSRGQYPNLQRARTVNAGESYTWSVFVKPAASGSITRCVLVQESYTGGYYAAFELSNGTVAYTSGANITNSTITPVNYGWYRISITYAVPTGKTFVSPQLRLGNYDGSDYTNQSFYAWGAKLEQNTTVTNYYPQSYLAVESVNMLAGTDTLSATGAGYPQWAGYCGSGIGLTANTTDIAAPDGTFTARKIVRDGFTTCGANAAWGMFWPATGIFTAGETYTVSIWVKSASGTLTGRLGLNDYFDTPITITTSWQRFTWTATVNTNSSIIQLDRGLQIYVQTANVTYYVWGAQLERGVTATPYKRVGAISNSVIDLSTGNYNAGVLQGTTLPSYNPAGYYTFTAASLNQISSTVQYASPGPQTFSIAVAFRTSVASGGKLIGFQNIQTGMTSTNYDRQLVVGIDGIVRFGIYNSFVSELPSSASLADGKWHYVVGTFSSGTMTLYVDGLKVNSRALVGQTIPQQYAGWWVVGSGNNAGWTNSGNQWYTGDIAKAEVYSTELSANQVLTQYNLLANRLGLAQRSADPATINDAPAKASSKVINSRFLGSYVTDFFGDLTLGTTQQDLTNALPTNPIEEVKLYELKTLNFGKVASEIFKANDNRTLLLTKKIIDFVSAVHSANLQWNDTSSKVDLSHIADSFAKVVSFVRSIPDTTSLVESRKKTITKPRTETARSTDAVLRVASYHKVFADTEHTSDTFRKVVSFNRTKNDTTAFSDVKKFTVSKPFTETQRAIDVAKRTIQPKKTDTVRTSDSFSRLVSYNKSLNSTATSTHFVDVVSTVKDFHRTFVQTAKSQDSVSRAWVARRSQAEIQKATDVFSKVVTFRRLPIEILRAQEVFLRVVTYNRSKADTSRATDVFSKVLTARRNPADISRAIDRITAKYFAKKLADTVQGNDHFYLSGFIHPEVTPGHNPTNVSKVYDQFRKLVSFIRQFNDTTTLAETFPKTVSKTAGTKQNTWFDFNEIYVAVELAQYYGSAWVDFIQPVDSPAKYVTKVANKTLTYYNNSIWDDYNDLSFGSTTVFDQDQYITYASSYTADSERALAADSFLRVLTYRRTLSDTSPIADVFPKTITRTVGDFNPSVFNDFNDLFYTNEFYSDTGGVNATALIEVVQPSVPSGTPTYSVTILNSGTKYSSTYQYFSVATGIGTDCSFQVAATYGDGKILFITNITGTPSRTNTQSAYFTDHAQLTFGTTADQDLVQYDARTYTYPSSVTVNVGPKSFETKRNVVGQDLLFTLNPTASGDTAKYSDAVGKKVSKNATQYYYPQGWWTDFADLSFGSGNGLDQDLSLNLTTSTPETISVIGTTSIATVGFTKRNRDAVSLADIIPKSLSKPKADTAGATQTFAKQYNVSAGAYANRTWRSYDETSLAVLSDVELSYEGRYELIQLGETAPKTFSKAVVNVNYIWTDYNELTFAATVDQDLVQTGFGFTTTTDYATLTHKTEISLAKPFTEVAKVVEAFPKTITKNGVGNTTLNDHLTYNPEYIPYLSLIDESLQGQYPNYKIDKSTVSDVKGAFLSKVILGPGPINKYIDTGMELTSFDDTVVTFGGIGYIGNQTFPDVKFLDYFESFTVSEDLMTPSQYGSDSAFSTDVFSRVFNSTRTFAETIHVADSMLLSKNGSVFFTLLRTNSDVAKSADLVHPFFITKAAGDVKSVYSTWQDFVELELATELAQYYYRGTDSTSDINRSVDVRTNQFRKKAGIVQNIWNTFDEEVYFTQDLVQVYPQDYVTEIISWTESSVKTFSKPRTDIVTVPETFPKTINKPTVGNTTVNDHLAYNPEYIAYFSLIDESLQAQYPSYKIDKSTVSDAKGFNFSKQAGFDPVNRWLDTGLELTNFDETLQVFGSIGSDNSAFALPIFNKYLDDFIYSEFSDLLNTPYKTEIIQAVDVLTRIASFKRTVPEIVKSVELAQKLLSKGTKSESLALSELAAKQYGKAAGKPQSIWSDFNEITIEQDLVQILPRSSYEIIFPVETITKKIQPKKTESIVLGEQIQFLPTKGFPHILLASQTIGKNLSIAQVGNSTSTFWLDTYEILSYDETLLTYGYMKTIKFDNASYSDSTSRQWNRKPGSYSTRIWSDFNEFNVGYDIAQYYDPYTTELLNPVDTATKRLNKGITENPRSTDSGSVRNFNSGAYVIDTSPYFLEDYTADGVTTSTF